MALGLVVMIAQPCEDTKTPENCTPLKRLLSVAVQELRLNF